MEVLGGRHGRVSKQGEPAAGVRGLQQAELQPRQGKLSRIDIAEMEQRDLPRGGQCRGRTSARRDHQHPRFQDRDGQ